MIRRFILVLTFGMALVSADRLLAAAVDAIIPSAVCEAHGLTRAWMEQMAVDSSRARVTHVVLDAGMLFCLHRPLGRSKPLMPRPAAPSGPKPSRSVSRTWSAYPFAVNHSLVAAVNGSHLYVLNRYTGELLWDKVLENVAGTGPTLGDQTRVHSAGQRQGGCLPPQVHRQSAEGTRQDHGSGRGQQRLHTRQPQNLPGVLHSPGGCSPRASCVCNP